MKTMKRQFRAAASLLAGVILFGDFASAQQLATPPASPADREATYTDMIEKRTEEILKPLNLTDSAKSNQLQSLIIAQYRVMRSRDELIDAKLHAQGKEINYANRAPDLEEQSKLLHDYFVTQISKLLPPDQVDQVKDKMTYNKVKVTFDAYNQIVPSLTDSDKAKVMELLKEAREKAIDGGSASEKSAIFQVYKNQINDYLNAHGHDVAQAYKDWEAKQALAKTSTTNATTNAVQ